MIVCWEKEISFVWMEDDDRWKSVVVKGNGIYKGENGGAG